MNLDNEIDRIIEYYDESFHAGNFREVDEYIARLKLTDMDPTLISSHVCFARWGRHKLSNFRLLFQRAKIELTKQVGPQETYELLRNLEP